MYATTITIGRNIGSRPMPQATWEMFQQQARATLRAALGYASYGMEVHKGTGAWDGVAEESVAITAFTRNAIDSSDVIRLEYRLPQLASKFEQDAIAWRTGESHLAVAGSELIAGAL